MSQDQHAFWAWFQLLQFGYSSANQQQTYYDALIFQTLSDQITRINSSFVSKIPSINANRSCHIIFKSMDTSLHNFDYTRMENRQQSYISTSALEYFKNYFLPSSKDKSSELMFIFFDYPYPKLQELIEVNVEKKKLISQIVYAWYVAAENNQKLQYLKLYLEVNREQITLFVRYRRVEGEGSPQTFLQFILALQKDLKYISQRTTFLPLQKSNQKLSNEDIMILKFLLVCKNLRQDESFKVKLKVNGAEQQEKSKNKEIEQQGERIYLKDINSHNRLVFLQYLETSDIMAMRYFILKMYRDSMIRMIKQIPHLYHLLKIEGILIISTYKKLLNEDIIKKYSKNRTLFIDNMPKNNFASIRQQYQSRKTSFSLKKDSVFLENIIQLELILNCFVFLKVGESTNLRTSEGYIVLDKQLLYYQIRFKSFYFTVAVTDEKDIQVSLQTDIKVFAEERDIRMHWIHLLKFPHIGFGSKIGMEFAHHRKKTKPLFTDNYVIFFASDKYTGSGLFFKVALLMDSLIMAYYILEPGMKKYLLNDTLADYEIEMERKMEFLYNAVSIKYEEEELENRRIVQKLIQNK